MPGTPGRPSSAAERGAVLGVDHDGVVGPVPAHQRVGGAGDERPAVLEHHDLVGQALGLDQEMGAHHDGVALVGHLSDELEHGVRRLGIKPRGRLVVQQEVGAVQHRSSQCQTGLHPRRVAAHLLVEGTDDAEAIGGRGDAVEGELTPAEAVELGRVGEVVLPGEPVVEGRLGGHDAAPTADLLPVDGGIESEHADLTRVWAQCAGDHPGTRRLAGTVRPEQDRDRLRRHGE